MFKLDLAKAEEPEIKLPTSIGSQKKQAVVAAKLLQSCPTLCDPIDSSPPGSPVPGILQVIVLEWIAISFSRGSSRPRDQTQVSHIVDRRFTI